ncbi:MAG TPA: hypothetical protein VG604_01315 [Candidatus Saccharimonadales bacterium]|nr:hypothetical protein [Candidatus Saccharimonadales bacterium]
MNSIEVQYRRESTSLTLNGWFEAVALDKSASYYCQSISPLRHPILKWRAYRYSIHTGDVLATYNDKERGVMDPTKAVLSDQELAIASRAVASYAELDPQPEVFCFEEEQQVCKSIMSALSTAKSPDVIAA